MEIHLRARTHGIITGLVALSRDDVRATLRHPAVHVLNGAFIARLESIAPVNSGWEKIIGPGGHSSAMIGVDQYASALEARLLDTFHQHTAELVVSLWLCAPCDDNTVTHFVYDICTSPPPWLRHDGDLDLPVQRIASSWKQRYEQSVLRPILNAFQDDAASASPAGSTTPEEDEGSPRAPVSPLRIALALAISVLQRKKRELGQNGKFKGCILAGYVNSLTTSLPGPNPLSITSGTLPEFEQSILDAIVNGEELKVTPDEMVAFKEDPDLCDTRSDGE